MEDWAFTEQDRLLLNWLGRLRPEIRATFFSANGKEVAPFDAEVVLLHATHESTGKAVVMLRSRNRVSRLNAEVFELFPRVNQIMQRANDHQWCTITRESATK